MVSVNEYAVVLKQKLYQAPTRANSLEFADKTTWAAEILILPYQELFASIIHTC